MNTKNTLKGGLYTVSILWTAWLIFKSNNMIDGYITAVIMLSSMIINDLVR